MVPAHNRPACIPQYTLHVLFYEARDAHVRCAGEFWFWKSVFLDWMSQVVGVYIFWLTELFR